MSRMQKAASPVGCNYAQPVNSIKSRSDNGERPPRISDPNGSEGHDIGREPTDSLVWIVQFPTKTDKGNGSLAAKSPIPPVSDRSARDRQRRSPARPRSIRREVSYRSPFGQVEDTSVDDQIRIFKERADVLKCLIPGMISGISRTACEGWRRQVISRSARYLAKIKLGPCKDCKHSS